MNFFIIGFPRSGTSIFRKILTSNKDICIPPENPHLVGLLKSKFDDVTIDAFSKDLAKRWRVDSRDITSRIVASEKSYSQVWVDIYRLASNSKLLLGDKTNLNRNYIPLLSKIYPSAKFIVLIRDPRAVYSSILALKNSSKDAPNISKNIFRFIISYNYYSSILLLCRSRDTLKINYEELCLNTEKTLFKISKFLHIEYDKNMLEKQNKDSIYDEPEHFSDWKWRTSQPLDSSRLFVWRNSLSMFQKSLIWLSLISPLSLILISLTLPFAFFINMIRNDKYVSLLKKIESFHKV